MSTLLYGAMTAQRLADDPNVPEDPKKGKAGLSTFADTVSALVPAEILAANAALLPLMTSTSQVKDEPVTTITDPSTLKVVFWLSIVFAILLFVAGERSRVRKQVAEGKPAGRFWTGANLVRAVIPAASYVAWVMLMPSTAFDAIAPAMSDALRATIAVFAAIGLGTIAKLLGDKADAEIPPA